MLQKEYKKPSGLPGGFGFFMTCRSIGHIPAVISESYVAESLYMQFSVEKTSPLWTYYDVLPKPPGIPA